MQAIALWVGLSEEEKSKSEVSESEKGKENKSEEAEKEKKEEKLDKASLSKLVDEEPDLDMVCLHCLCVIAYSWLNDMVYAPLSLSWSVLFTHEVPIFRLE